MPVIRGTVVPTADELIETFRKAGFVPGTPPAYTAAARDVDTRIVHRLKCPGCGRREMSPYFMARGDRLRIVAMCPHPDCLAGEEV
jgi:hypothetical protein